LPQDVVGTSHIDKIRRVSNRLDNPRFSQGLSKERNLLGRDWLGVPLVVVLGEELDGLAIHSLRRPNSAVIPAGDRHVSTKLVSGGFAVLATAHGSNH
jgi:hypothetical protein